MKKLLFVLPLMLVFATPVSAASTNGQQGTVTQTQQQTQMQLNASSSPMGNQIQNQNQVSTQNQGEESQIQTQTQEEESLDASQTVTEKMETVGQKVQEILKIRTTNAIGDQVKLVAQEQSVVSTQIQEQLTKIDTRSKLSRFLTGTDFGAIKNLKMQMEQNQLRIQQLEQIKTMLVNKGDITLIQETIQALVDQNTSLQDKIAIEEQTKSLFGWLFKLFAQ